MVKLSDEFVIDLRKFRIDFKMNVWKTFCKIVKNSKRQNLMATAFRKISREAS